MPASGSRSTTTPNRPRPSGTGKIGQHYLTCGHVSPGVPSFRKAGAGSVPVFWCDAPECRCYRRRA